MSGPGSPDLYTGNSGLYERQRSGSLTNLITQPLSGAGIITYPGMWTSVGNGAGSSNTIATTTKAAGGAGVRHVCWGVIATVAAGANAVSPKTLTLRDGATGVGTVIFAGTLAAPVNASSIIALTGLNIIGSANTAMCLEFDAASVAGHEQIVTLVGYSIS